LHSIGTNKTIFYDPFVKTLCIFNASDSHAGSVDPGWMPGAHQSHSITPLPLLDGGEKKYNQRLIG